MIGIHSFAVASASVLETRKKFLCSSDFPLSALAISNQSQREMAEKDTFLAIENAVEQLELVPAIVQQTHKLKSLKSRLRTMGMLLEKFEGKDYEPDVAEWLKKVRAIAYETQNVIGSIEANYQNKSSKLGRLLSGGRVTKHREEEITEIEERLKDICSFRDDAGSISSKIDEVVGFKVAHKTLVTQLIGDSRPQREVILIHGKAGSGKTTLAKMVFNDESIKKHFEPSEWVSLTHALPLEEQLCRFLKHTSSPSNPTDFLSRDELKARCCKYLKGKRYLIVIDSKHISDEIDELMSLFPDESNGSRILLASRLPQADVQQRFSFSYEIKPLDLNLSWQLLSRKVFEGEIYPDLENLGKRMVEKCNGLPQAIVALAKILNRAEKTKEMWSRILEDYDSNPPEELQLYLLYFGLFPEGYKISAKQMIQMWKAEGLLKEKSGKRSEEIGEDYLKKLIDQSFIHVHTKRADGSVKTCSNEVSRLCIPKAAAMKFFEVNDHKPQEGIKRMAIHSDSVTDVLTGFGDCSDVQSLHCFGKININSTSIRSVDFWKTLLHNFHSLRVLNLDLELDKVTKEFGKLTNLRYLRLRAPNAKHLRSSIVNLSKLETLDMRESHLVSLPHGIWKMQFLRHLYLRGATSLPRTRSIDYYRALPNLQTLSGVNPNKDLKWLMVRAKFPNVKKLRICFDLGTPDKDAVFLNSLDHLCHLQSLRVENQTQLPDLNAFPLSLTKLTLLKTKLHPHRIEILSKLPNLRILKLLEEAIRGEKIECSEGGFLQLEALYIKNLVVTEWNLGRGAMQHVKLFFIKGSKSDVTSTLETAPTYLQQVAKQVAIEENGTH